VTGNNVGPAVSSSGKIISNGGNTVRGCNFTSIEAQQ